MDLVAMTNGERMRWKRRRRDYLNDIANKYTSLEDFFYAEDFNLTIRGYTVWLCSKYVSITIFLDYTNYEEYYVVPDKSGVLRVSNLIMWQDDCCANSYDYLGKEHLREDEKLIDDNAKDEDEEGYTYNRCVSHRFYPQKLVEIGDDCPADLYAKGCRWLLHKDHIVAIVGSRDCDDEGRILAYKLAQKAAREGKVVISGLARGIDTSAHLGCLDAGGNTIAVVGSGLDIVHPKENEWLQERIKVTDGLILSEQPNGVKANPTRLVARCRILAALADEVIVVQCGNPSGTLHTIEFARKYGKPVYAVKYDELMSQNAGNHYLLENGLAQPLNKWIDGSAEPEAEETKGEYSDTCFFPKRFYPKQLLAIGGDCPKELYYTGAYWLMRRQKEIVAIIGGRDCDEEDRILAYKLAQKATREGKIVLSGLARGIDTSAHLGCLDACGETIAVVGSGIDIIHPKENDLLQERIKVSGGLILSEQPNGVKANPTRLIARCRIQAALADEVIVVQCGKPSGTLHTAEFARKYGKPVYAVKYNYLKPQNAGNHYLLENGIAEPLMISD